MDIAAYLQRINYSGPLTPSADSLCALQNAHLVTVPFENLSIHYQQPIVLDDEALFNKIVTRRRGGFCYELNGLFAALLRSLGFKVSMLSARVANAAGEFGPDFDHMTLMVELDQRWLVDVGFGDSFRSPLLLDLREEQVQDDRTYKLEPEGDRLLLWQRLTGEDWKPQYSFNLHSFNYGDYTGMCHYHQTSPESHFTRGRICSRATPNGRTSLSELRLITSESGQRNEQLVSEDEYLRVLKERFDVDLAGLERA